MRGAGELERIVTQQCWVNDGCYCPGNDEVGRAGKFIFTAIARIGDSSSKPVTRR